MQACFHGSPHYNHLGGAGSAAGSSGGSADVGSAAAGAGQDALIAGGAFWGGCNGPHTNPHCWVGDLDPLAAQQVLPLLPRELVEPKGVGPWRWLDDQLGVTHSPGNEWKQAAQVQVARTILGGLLPPGLAPAGVSAAGPPLLSAAALVQGYGAVSAGASSGAAGASADAAGGEAKSNEASSRRGSGCGRACRAPAGAADSEPLALRLLPQGSLGAAGSLQTPPAGGKHQAATAAAGKPPVHKKAAATGTSSGTKRKRSLSVSAARSSTPKR